MLWPPPPQVGGSFGLQGLAPARGSGPSPLPGTGTLRVSCFPPQRGVPPAGLSYWQRGGPWSCVSTTLQVEWWGLPGSNRAFQKLPPSLAPTGPPWTPTPTDRQQLTCPPGRAAGTAETLLWLWGTSHQPHGCPWCPQWLDRTALKSGDLDTQVCAWERKGEGMGQGTPRRDRLLG